MDRHVYLCTYVSCLCECVFNSVSKSIGHGVLKSVIAQYAADQLITQREVVNNLIRQALTKIQVHTQYNTQQHTHMQYNIEISAHTQYSIPSDTHTQYNTTYT